MSLSTLVVLAVAVGAARFAWRRGARLVGFGFATFAVLPAFALIRTTPGWLLALLATPVALLLCHGYGRTSATVIRWGARSRRKAGVASTTDIVRVAGSGAMRARAGTVRPSLAPTTRSARWTRRWSVPTVEVAVLLCRAGLLRVWASVEDVICIFGGPRTGKSQWLAGRILDAAGAVLVTSTRMDLYELTAALRARRGPIYVFNPVGLAGLTSTITFDPLTGCTSPVTAAERAADLLAAGSRASTAGDREFWESQARRVLTALLHAAALAPALTMADVLRWVSDPDAAQTEVTALLRRSPEEALGQDARQFLTTNEKTRSSITSTIMPALGWLTHDAAAAAATGPRTGGAGFDVAELLATRATVYLLGAEETQTAALVSALTGHIAREARRIAAFRPGGRLDPPLTLALDEAALICPVPLHQWTADMGGRGVTIICAFQSRAQLLDRYGEAKAEVILNNTAAVMVFGGTRSRDDLTYWATLGGERDQLRAQLVTLGRVEEHGVPLGMGATRSEWRGTVAGVGDLVQARRNAWHLEGWSGNGSAPVNRQTYRVLATHPTGGMTVARVTGRDPENGEQLAEPILLPAAYVREQVTLAYAATVHAAHGRTVDGGYGVVGPGTDGASAYVQATRGRDTNVLFLVTQHSHDDHQTGETAASSRRSPVDVLSDVIRPPELDANRTALTEAETAAENARSIAAQLDPLGTVIADVTAGRTQRWLDELAAAGHLPDHHRVALAADEARTALDQLLRTIELAGHDPAQALADAVTRTNLGGSTSVAQVLHFRLREAYRDHLTPQLDSYADLIPRHLPDHVHHSLLDLATAADDRRAELGHRLAHDPPQWAREALGPVPDTATDPAERASWEQRAGWAASYRELAGHDDPADALGAAPPRGLPETHAAFHAAHAALGLPEVGAVEEDMSEGKLRALWAAWQRELNTAPRYVADELDATHEALRRARENATVWQARADAVDDPLARDELITAATDAREEAARLTELVEQLEYADQARALFFTETAVTRDNAERARVAAGWKGVDLADTSDRVTAQEWLDAHLVAQLANDADRDITEDDTLDIDDETHNDRGPDRPAHDRDDGRAAGESRDAAPDALVPDLRDLARPDPTERADPATRRRIPPPDLAAEALERATLLVRDVAQRRHAEQAAAAHAAQQEPEEDQLRAELARQATYDLDADVDAAETTDHVDEILNRS